MKRKPVEPCSVQTLMFHWVIDSMRKVLNGASHKKAKIKRRQRRFISKISYLGDRQTSIFLLFFLSVSLEFLSQTFSIHFFSVCCLNKTILKQKKLSIDFKICALTIFYNQTYKFIPLFCWGLTIKCIFLSKNVDKL